MPPLRSALTAVLAALCLILAVPSVASAGEWVAGAPNLVPPAPGTSMGGPLTVTDHRGVTTLAYSSFVFGDETAPKGVWVTRRHPGETGFDAPRLVPGSDLGQAVSLFDLEVDPDGNVTLLWEEYHGPIDRPVALRTLKPDDTFTELQRPFDPHQREQDFRLAVGGHGEVSLAALRPIYVPSGNHRTVLRVARRRSLDGTFGAPQEYSPTTGWRVDVHNIAMGPDGEAFMAWTEVSSDGLETRRARTSYAPAGGSFGPVVALQRPAGQPDHDYFTAFDPAIDSAGRVHLLFTHGGRWHTVRSPGASGTFGAPVKATEWNVAPQAVMSRDGDWTLVFTRDDGAGQAVWASTRRAGEAGFTETRLTPEGVNLGDQPRIGVGPNGDAMVTWGVTDIDGYVRLKSLTRPAGETAWGNLRTFTPAGHISRIHVPMGINVDQEGNVLAIFDQDGVLKTRGYDAHGPRFDPLPSQPPAANDQLQFSVSDAWTGIASATWSFGDGTTATGAKVDHVYAAAGTYTQTVTAEDGAGNAETLTRQIVVSGPRKPRLEAAPRVTGRAQVDFELSTDGGTWAGDPTSFSRQWLRCDAAGANCLAIAGATATSYTLKAADEGRRLRVRETATNGVGTSDPAVSAPSDVVLPPPPHNQALPEITGRPRTGHTLSASTGEWDGDPTGYAFQWRRCDGQGLGCTDIAGATAGAYTLAAADKGRRLRVRVVATSDRGDSQPATSAPTPLVTDPIPPSNVAKPSITGEAVADGFLQGDGGTWSEGGFPSEYQWQRCNSAGAACANIANATGSGYSVADSDVGHRLRLRVRAQNEVGFSEYAVSDPTAVVTGRPVNTAPPAIAGTARAGQTLTASNGSWSGGPTSYEYAWLRCDAAGENCQPLNVGTADYTVQPFDTGSRLRVDVSATNAAGTSAPARSAPTAVVAPAPAAPTVLAAPEISGSAVVGRELVGSDGSWTGSPTSYARQWLRCDPAPGTCTEVPGATDLTLIVTDADADHSMKLRVTASNADGTSAPSESAATAPVVGIPANLEPPSLSGLTFSGGQLHSRVGGWSRSPSSFAISWLRCDASGEGCATVPGAAGELFQLTDADVGRTLRSVVVASNEAGSSAPVRSPASVAISAGTQPDGPPVFTPGTGGPGGGDGGQGGPGPAGPPATVPSGVVDLETRGKLKLAGKGAKLKLKLGVAAVCPASAAPAGCELAVSIRRGGKVIKRQTVKLAAGASTSGLAVKLGKAYAKRARKGLKLDVTVVGSIAGQKTSQARRAGTVRARR